MTAPAAHPVVTEAAWQKTVRQAAAMLNWRCYHTRFSFRSDPGFPDLICVKYHRVLALELKSERGRVTAAQQEWIDALAAVPGVTAMVARPSDWPAIERALNGEGP